MKSWLLSLPQSVLLALVRGYRFWFKPWLGNACRFEPTCSAYALQALQRHGALRGAALTGWRLMRCHPWCDGGCDPVPDNFSCPRAGLGLFTRLLARRDDDEGGRPAAPHPPTRKHP
jgi:uncharacterized protein